MKRLLLIPFLLIAVAIMAQEVPVNTEQQLENLSEENIEDDALLQQLSFYQKNPLNLNTASADELTLLRFLTDLQIQHLLSYRTLFGNLLSIYELQAVPGFDLLTIRKLLPFVFVGPAQSVKESFAARLRGGNRFALFRLSRTLERSKGYNPLLMNRYLGNRNQLQTRYVYQYKNLLYYGVVADKDPGEQFFKGAQKQGFDFYSAHFFVRNLGKVKALALGDYALNLGQGLIQWQSLAFGKSAEVMNSKRQAPVLLPYRSAGEFFFNRGAAATVQLGAVQATAFVSFKNFSGNVVADSVNRFTSFGTSGLHRTPLEVADRNRLSHFSWGGSLSYSMGTLKLAANAVGHRFSLPLQKRDEPYNRFAMAGRNHFLASFDYSYTFRNAHFFGEVASSTRSPQAMVHGALISIDSRVDLSVLYRRIGKEFQSPFGNAFTESTLPSNENGLYTGMQIRPGNGWQVAAYADAFSFPFLRFRVSAPTRGWDYMAQITFLPQKQTELHLRYRHENKPLDRSGTVINIPVNQPRQNLRLHFSTQLNTKLALKARTEMNWFQREGRPKEEGFLAYLETIYEPIASVRTNFRMQYFETGSYDSRIYAYETDVLYSFAIPAFFGKGFRFYVTTSVQASKHLSVWLRLAQTLYQDRNIIGSGLDEINGSRRTDLRLQVRYRF